MQYTTFPATQVALEYPSPGRAGPGRPPHLWIVEATSPGMRTISWSRCAARPVGAHMATLFPWLAQYCTMARVAKVLPQPGPPVRMQAGYVTARVMATRWPSLNLHESRRGMQRRGEMAVHHGFLRMTPDAHLSEERT